ncbi:MAG: hypothetical protein KJ558_07095 [Gammaproteobacteria bacterium]|nr:hypothetical protein [Gammaproteobacteria bacterium]MBU1654582.1 hypothetical protein [Gammaproteobacteria bacterium]MBU1961974.1 hypothetical protein [Gammaproteobacteria bacterium]
MKIVPIPPRAATPTPTNTLPAVLSPEPATQAQPQPDPAQHRRDPWDDRGLSPWSRWMRRRICLRPELFPTPAKIAEATRILTAQWRTGDPWRRMCLAALAASTAVAGLEVALLLRDVITLAPAREGQAWWGVLIVAAGPMLAALMARRGAWSYAWLIAWFWSLMATPSFPVLAAVAGVGVLVFGGAIGAFAPDKDGNQDADQDQEKAKDHEQA